MVRYPEFGDNHTDNMEDEMGRTNYYYPSFHRGYFDRLASGEPVQGNLFAYAKGRMFERWTDSVSGSARDNGFNADALIECPPYIIESIIRDEIFTERDLQITTATDTTHMICSGLMSSEDDYYNNAIYYNATRDVKTYVSDYTGSTKTLILGAADASAATGDNIILGNVQGDVKIDYATFDTIGNTTNGTRKDWVFARSINSLQPAQGLLDSLCFDSHVMLFEGCNEDTAISRIKIKDLDVPASGDTWNSPGYISLPLIKLSFTDLANIYTQFRLFYAYDHAKGDYGKSIYVDSKGYPSTATILGATEQNLCNHAEKTYQLKNLFEYSSDWIYNDATAERFLQKKINWFTKQRLMVEWVSTLTDGTIDYIKYEQGDKVKLNYANMIPLGLNNSSYFMIYSKRIITMKGSPSIEFKLIEL